MLLMSTNGEPRTDSHASKNFMVAMKDELGNFCGGKESQAQINMIDFRLPLDRF